VLFTAAHHMSSQSSSYSWVIIWKMFGEEYKLWISSLWCFLQSHISSSLSSKVYIYIYICVYVCVCVCKMVV
jgi:purine nucleoside permease